MGKRFFVLAAAVAALVMMSAGSFALTPYNPYMPPGGFGSLIIIPPADSTVPWPNEIFKSGLEFYKATVLIEGDKYRAVLYGQLDDGVDYTTLKAMSDFSTDLNTFCTAGGAVVPECVAAFGPVRIVPWMVNLTSIGSSKPYVMKTDYTVKCDLIEGTSKFRCVLPKMSNTGSLSAEDRAQKLSSDLSGTVAGQTMRMIAFAATSSAGDKSISPVIDLAGILVGSDADTDGDKIPDVMDNCPDVVNADQAYPVDSDGDGTTDACKAAVSCSADDDAADCDGDGVANGVDQCDDTPSGTTVDSVGCTVPAADTTVGDGGGCSLIR